MDKQSYIEGLKKDRDARARLLAFIGGEGFFGTIDDIALMPWQELAGVTEAEAEAKEDTPLSGADAGDDGHLSGTRLPASEHWG